MKNSPWKKEYPRSPGYYWVKLVRFTPSQNSDMSEEEKRKAREPFIVYFREFGPPGDSPHTYPVTNEMFIGHNFKRMRFVPVVPAPK